ncbi:hypothetical protein JCM3770_003619 [Rhodotorula araucariae]
MHGALRPWLAVLLLCALVLAPPAAAAFYSPERKRHLRAVAAETWRHAYGAYKRVAFPADELLPLACTGQGHDRSNRDNTEVNDVMGDYLLTVVDSLDTFPMLGDRSGFDEAVREVIQHVSFDLDSRVQVFEVTIRMMGGLLSGHLLALEPAPPGTPSKGSTFTSSIRGFSLPWYHSELLHLAHDLGRRLLPAFETPTGIPFARVHLRDGLRGRGGKGESGETCAAGAGSLLLEFITLSRLTGDARFELAARRAFFAVWNRRSEIGLVGNTIDVRTGVWLHAVGGTGAGIDSFYEYAAKAYILTGEDEYFRVWEEGYAALQKYVRSTDGFWYRGANMHTGALAATTVDSLSAFLPGVQALMGDLDSATRAHAPYAFIWARYRGLPELFDTHRRKGAGLELGYPLRPEFIESNMYLYQATRDDWYLGIAERVLHDINNRTRVECGFAAIKDLRTGELEDKMPSFVTGETLKYLFLTFAEDSPFLTSDAPFVFTTEGHPLEIPRTTRTPTRARAKKRSPPPAAGAGTAKPAPTCAAHAPSADMRYAHALALGMDRRVDWEHARWLVGLEMSDEEGQRLLHEGTWRPDGRCELPLGEDPVTLSTRYAAALTADFGIELLFAAASSGEVTSPSSAQLASHENGSGDLVVQSILGLRFSLARVPAAPGAAAGYAVTRVAGVQVPRGRSVVLRDRAVLAGLDAPHRPRVEKVRVRAEVGTWDEVRPLVSEEEEPGAELPGGRGKLDRFLEMMLGVRAGAGTDAAVGPPVQITLEDAGAEEEGCDVPPAGADRATLDLAALAASFGPSLSPPALESTTADFVLNGAPLAVVCAPASDPFGCAPVPDPLEHSSTLVLVRRGECSFAVKAHHAARAGHAGVLVVSAPSAGDGEHAEGQREGDGEGFVVPSAEASDEASETMQDLVPLVLLGRTDGEALEAFVRGVNRWDREPGAWTASWEDEPHVEEEDKGRDGLEAVWVTVTSDEPEEEEVTGNVVLGGYLTTNIKLYRGRAGGQ